jgi:type 1 fimbriae regulatory protein FimB/type 1 fimbriae regulatory protein FimE
MTDTKKSRAMPRKPKNADRRDREYLTSDEIDKMSEATYRLGRNGLRDALLILLMYRHGLRVSEAVRLRWSHVDLMRGTVIVDRANGGTTTVHPMTENERVTVSNLYNPYTCKNWGWYDRPPATYVFGAEHGGPLSASSVYKIVARAGKKANIPFPVHPHMLRHSCGYHLAQNTGNLALVQKYLGHKSPQHVMRYAEPAEEGSFEGLWDDD